ncbi:hypothetical protein NE857_32730 [Nocardiopsis exhalans]|uniref:Class IIb bacteriocin, lactobin A/cerein 7B family n=1 Tax=Nocardiopsis exhalans TaxID=163604 RepID=A0ABY5D6D3_9ACTN|nr:daptide-type RiPP [Nocardiopsis exhalans]USY19936.1 hypothetical protein NE857_32725 [Nocardiopsis exhalans]USY19937.1 hypothetical protein NE857_32730 [Nocardiopsis exhalans]
MTNQNDTTAQAAVNPELELEMQELEAMEAPGFWTGVSIGVGISASVATSVAIT